MYYTRFYAENYIGFYAKLGIDKLDIDLSLCKNKIISIQGGNGCGKSTLIKIMHLFPDSNDNFRPMLDANKGGTLICDDIQYDFNIIHKVKNNGTRETPKAYIRKYINGNMIEMNPNGNVTSYKEYIYSEFGLDPSFLLLLFLSISNKGIVDRTPSERKKYIDPLIAEVETYNNFLKTLSKRRSNIKSIMGNITSKLNMIGDVHELELALESLNNRINNSLREKDSLIENLAEAKSKITILDPNGTIQESYEKMYNDLVELNKNIDLNKKEINKLSSKCDNVTKDNFEDLLNTNKSNLISLNYNIQSNEKEIRRILDDREKESKEVSELSAKLEGFNISSEIINIENDILECNNKLNEYQNILSMMGFDNKGDLENISKEEFIVGLNALKEIKDIIDIARDNLSENIISNSVDTVINNRVLLSKEDIDNKIEDIKNEINKNNIELSKYRALEKEVYKLKDRAEGCIIDTCPFIKDAVLAFKQEPEKNIIKIECTLEELSSELNRLELSRVDIIDIISGVNYLNSICKYLESNISIIRKLPVDINIFNSKESIINAIIDGYNFDEIDIIYKYIEYANIIEERKIVLKNKEKFESDFNIFLEKNKIVDEIMTQINTLNDKINKATIDIEELKSDIKETEKCIGVITKNIIIIESLEELFNKENKLLEIKSNIINQYNTIKNNIIEIKRCLDIIDNFNNKIATIEKQLNPLLSDRDKLNHSLQLSREYKIELDIFNKKYNKINTLRKYCNPSESGLQLLFIELYFHKTLSLTNELLQYVFNGEYKMDKPSIKGDEFKIPVIGNLLPVDDVSSMSESQRAIIGMALSFSLVFQSSTLYNIPALDEVDEPLDTENRLAFSTLLDKIINILNIEQLLYVSHNSEVSLENADIILLSDRPEMVNKFSQYNIIYKI